MQTAAALPGTPFNPTQISGCALWLDANDPTTLTLSGSSVVQWRDKSGNGLLAVSNAVVNWQQPTYNSTGPYSYVSMAPSQALYITGFPLTTSWSVFSCMCNVTLGARWYISPYADAGIVLMGMSEGASKIFSGLLPSGNTTDITGSHIEYTSAQNTNGTGAYLYYRDGTLQSSNNTANSIAATTVRLGIGGNATYNADINGTYYPFEIIIFNQYLGDTQRRQVEGYLAQKWGLQSTLPQGHPGLTGIIYPTGTRQRIAGPIQYYQNFLPTQIPGCSFWLDGADNTKITKPGAYITQIIDKAGGVTLTATGTTLTTTTINGVQSLNFPGTTYLSGSGSNPSSAYMFFVFTVNSTNNAGYFSIFSWHNTEPVSNIVCFGYPGSATLIGFYESNQGVQSPTTSVSVGTTYLMAASYNGTATTLAVNGAITPTTGSQPTPASAGATSAVYVGVDYGPSIITINLGEIIVFNTSSITNTQRQQVESYLAAKWNLVPQIPTSHPHFTTPAGKPILSPPLQKQAIPLDRYVFNYVSNFSLTNFTVGGTFTPVISSGTLQLANNGGSQGNYAWHIQKQSITSFQTTFIMNFQSTNADGSAFVIQNSSSTAVGSVGGGLAYQGIGTSLAITLKSYNGSAGQFTTEVLTGGSAPNLTGASGVLNTSLGLTAGGTWNFLVNIKYNGTNLQYTITNTANSNSYTSNAPYNIPSLVGANTAYVGFTTGTGGLAEYCYLNSWSYQTFNLPA
jgi:hypothetical protein